MEKKTASHSENPDLNPLYAILDHPQFMLAELRRSTAKLKMHYDTLDLELGRRYEPLHHFKVRPKASLRAAWINQDYDIDYLYSNGTDAVAHDQKFDNDFRGVGLRGGVDTHFAVTPHFGFFGNLALGLVGGRFHILEKFTETLNTILPPRRGVYVDIHDRFFDLVPEMEIALGLHLEPGSSRNRYRLEIDLGWEYLVWFNQNQIFLFTTNSAAASGVGLREKGNLSFQGVVLSAKLHF